MEHKSSHRYHIVGIDSTVDPLNSILSKVLGTSGPLLSGGRQSQTPPGPGRPSLALKVNGLPL